MQSFCYIAQGIKAAGHSPVYKMHKYFARRPHNVFRYLIESYTKPGETILDPFLGGGVTLFEGLATGRQVIGVDVNPLAAFISDAQTTKFNIADYLEIIGEIRAKLEPLIAQYYTTLTPQTGKLASVRWYELAYQVVCRSCSCIFPLSDSNKETKNGRPVNGKYQCPDCKKTIDAVDANRVGYELLSVTYLIDNDSMKRETKKSENFDIELVSHFEKNFDALIKEYGLWYPTDTIPIIWDRQQEDCLYRKSVKQFSDFHTKRSLFFNAFLRKCFLSYKGSVSSDIFKILLFTFSAILRFTNNMTISTGNWMDGRPAAWAKHAYWIPNQFVEVNPIEYLDKRVAAIVSGFKYQQEQLVETIRVNTYQELNDKKGTHIVWLQSSQTLDIPDESIDAIITDPPYGSNVQYGELTHYWLVWLRDEIPVGQGLFNLDSEILVTRKTSKKDYQFYFQGLYAVFKEGYRVLKPGGVMALTFNNKNIKAWYALTKAAIEAGFMLEPQGIIYQEPIENYKNTAHTRYAGSLHGDFIYTFRKVNRDGKQCFNQDDRKNLKAIEIEELVKEAVDDCIRTTSSVTTSELYISILRHLIPILMHIVVSRDELESMNRIMEMKNLDGLLSRFLSYEAETGVWKRC